MRTYAFAVIKTLSILVSDKGSCSPPAGVTGVTSGRQIGRGGSLAVQRTLNILSMNLKPSQQWCLGWKLEGFLSRVVS